MRRVLLLSLALALTGASPAAAGEVNVTAVSQGDRSGDHSYAYVELHGAPGEWNAVTVTGRREALVIRDAGAPLTAGPGCRALDAHTAECRSSYPPLKRVQLHGEDGDDVLVDAAPGISGTLIGGPGDDELRGDDWQSQDGGEGADRLVGGARADTLQGGAGPDEVHAGKGPDRVLGDPAGAQGWADVLDGGAGADTVSYEGRATAVTVDLEATAPQGGPGEGDLLSGFESATGGDGADLLRGTDGRNTLVASNGDDVLVGRGGPDYMLGSPGDDRLEGGPGDDWLDGAGGSDTYVGGPGNDRLVLFLSWYWDADDDARAAVSCGRGRDLVDDPDGHTLLPRDCELIRFEPFTLRVVRATSGGLVLRLVKVRIRACRVTIRVIRWRDGRVLARRVLRGRRIDLHWHPHAGGRVLVRLRAARPCDSGAGGPVGAFQPELRAAAPA